MDAEILLIVEELKKKGVDGKTAEDLAIIYDDWGPSDMLKILSDMFKIMADKNYEDMQEIHDDISTKLEEIINDVLSDKDVR